MSDLMDYGPDWPPAPAPPPPEPGDPLWKQAAVRVGVILAMWAICALFLRLVAPDAGVFKLERPREGTSTFTPTPANDGR